MSLDYSLEESQLGVITAHKPDCPYVRALADAGEPVITLFDCKMEITAEFVRHSCLDKEER